MYSSLLLCFEKIGPLYSWGLMLSFFPVGWNVVFKCQFLAVELLQVRR